MIPSLGIPVRDTFNSGEIFRPAPAKVMRPALAPGSNYTRTPTPLPGMKSSPERRAEEREHADAALAAEPSQLLPRNLDGQLAGHRPPRGRGNSWATPHKAQSGIYPNPFSPARGADLNHPRPAPKAARKDSATPPCFRELADLRQPRASSADRKTSPDVTIHHMCWSSFPGVPGILAVVQEEKAQILSRSPSRSFPRGGHGVIFRYQNAFGDEFREYGRNSTSVRFSRHSNSRHRPIPANRSGCYSQYGAAKRPPQWP